MFQVLESDCPNFPLGANVGQTVHQTVDLLLRDTLVALKSRSYPRSLLFDRVPVAEEGFVLVNFLAENLGRLREVGVYKKV